MSLALFVVKTKSDQPCCLEIDDVIYSSEEEVSLLMCRFDQYFCSYSSNDK